MNVNAVLCSTPQQIHFIDAKRSAAVGGILEFMPDSFVREYYEMNDYQSVKHNNGTLEFSGLDRNKCNITVLDCVPFSSILDEIGIVQADLWILVSFIKQ